MDKSSRRKREGEKSHITSKPKLGGPETRTEMSMAPYATCLCANKFLVRVPNRGVEIRRVSGPYAKGDGTGRGRRGERISCSGIGEEKEGKKAPPPRSLFSILSCRICECARSFPTASDIHEEYCNHVLEKKENEKEKKKGANFGHKAPLCAAISRLFEKRPSGESVICMRNIYV